VEAILGTIPSRCTKLELYKFREPWSPGNVITREGRVLRAAVGAVDDELGGEKSAGLFDS
jgi:hypothetical protein